MKTRIIIMIMSVFLLSGCNLSNAPDTSTIGIHPDTVIKTEVVNNNTMPVITTELIAEIAQGKVEGASLIHKFGASELTTSMGPITQSKTYQTPETAMSLEFVSGSAQDGVGGTGALEITIVGLNSSWEEVTQVISTNGLTPVQIPINLTRLYRWYVSSSGSYSNPLTASHSGELTIRGIGGGTVWSKIVIDPLPIAQSQIGVYTIPAGKVGYLLSKNVFTDTSKSADIYLFQRCNANDTISPYSGIRKLIEREVGVQGGFSISFEGGKGPFIGPCDIGFMGGVSVGTADVSVEFELVQLNSN